MFKVKTSSLHKYPQTHIKLTSLDFFIYLVLNIIMNNKSLYDYVKKFGNNSFVAMPFNEVDAAILSLLSYMNFNELVPTLNEEGHDTIFSSMHHKDLEEYLLEGTVTPNLDRKLFRLCVNTKRYGSMHLNYILNHFDKEKIVQFFAITYILDNDFAVVTYRGTDSSLVGWKEDLMMALDDHIPSFKVADTYLNDVSSLLKGHPIIVLGHSKGGVLSVYAASNAKKEVQDQIIRVFDLDGPGFNYALHDEEGYKRIYPKIYKYIPIDSLIGILLENRSHTKIVKAKSFSIFQHTPYNWYVNNTHFATATKQTKRSLSFSHNMRIFIQRLNEEDKKTFIDILFSIFEEAEVHTIHDLSKKIERKVFSAIKSVSSILKDEKKGAMFKKVISIFIHVYFQNIGRPIEDEPEKEVIAYYEDIEIENND